MNCWSQGDKRRLIIFLCNIQPKSSYFEYQLITKEAARPGCLHLLSVAGGDRVSITQ